MTRYRAPPTMARMLASNAFARVAKGPVGSGKSSGCVKEIGRRACEQEPFEGVRRTRFAIIRNTYRELRDTTRKTFEQWIPPQSGEWKEADFTFILRARLPDGTRVECEVLFRSLDRPEDVRKLLSLELTGAYVNELREIPKETIDVLETRLGRYPSKAQGGPTWFGWWGDTNPWHAGHWGAKLFARPPEGYELYTQPGGRTPLAENVENLPPGYYERLCRGKDEEWITVYVDGQDATAIHGSIYGKLIAALRARRGVTAFRHPLDLVFTSWDLGIADSLAIWFWRFNEWGGIDLIDWYENSGEALSHYFALVLGKPYKYARHYLPHDAKARSLQTGKSTLEQTAKALGSDRVSVLPALDVDDGIAEAREMLEQPTTRFHERCDLIPSHRDFSGMGMLAEYRYAWDEANKVFTKMPLHNFASHTADGFRYVAMAVKHAGIVHAPKPLVPDPPLVRDPGSFTLSELRRLRRPPPRESA